MKSAVNSLKKCDEVHQQGISSRICQVKQKIRELLKRFPVKDFSELLIDAMKFFESLAARASRKIS
jgi:hypothetical protein